MQGEPKKLEENAKNILESYSTTQKMKFSIKGFLSKCDQIRSFLWICSHLLKKSLMENFIFCAVVCFTLGFTLFQIVSIIYNIDKDSLRNCTISTFFKIISES